MISRISYLRLVPFCCIAATLSATATAQGGYFKDDFSWGFNSGIWEARSGNNDSPFGCTFTPDQITPSSQGIALLSSSGSCSELRTKQSYSYGKVQGALRSSGTAGTVASIFSYTSWWDVPGRAWQEIDIEFLPSRGNVVHTNVIYQPQGGYYQSWEKDIDLGQYGLNVTENVLTIGFDWQSWKIDWYVYDQWGNYRVIRTMYRDNGDGYIANNEVPQYAWPKDSTRFMINNWHGDNSGQAQSFPGWYNQESAWAYYDYIEYQPH
ncbi:MAG: family 16 glycosylhydrolase [Reinekea sp.]|jgi:endo-1,3-1,4-beta-glycanase ExoK